MGFWSKLGHGLKSVGKVALKAAPIASMFVPGLQGFGLAAMLGRAGIGAGASLAGGGGLKGALLGGGLGVGAGALGKGSSIWSKLAKTGANGVLGHAAGGGGNPYALPGAEEAMAGTDGSQGGGGFWSNLGHKALGMGANGLFQTGTNVAGNVAKGMASGREKQIANTIGVNRIQAEAHRNAMIGALGKNVQDVNIERPAGIPTAHVTGGLRPSAMGVEGRAAAAADYDAGMKTLTHLPSPKAGTMENILGTAGAIGAGVRQAQTSNQTSSIVQRLLEQQAAAEAQNG